jgi:two-component system chemotaxis response regulator CheY
MASSGAEAIELFSKAINEKKIYDVIFLDIMMPEMNGQEVLTQIRNLEQSNDIVPGQGTKVIVITGLDDETAAFESHVLGCEGYLMKPFSRTQVQEKLLELGYWAEK